MKHSLSKAIKTYGINKSIGIVYHALAFSFIVLISISVTINTGLYLISIAGFIIALDHGIVVKQKVEKIKSIYEEE